MDLSPTQYELAGHGEQIRGVDGVQDWVSYVPRTHGDTHSPTTDEPLQYMVFPVHARHAASWVGEQDLKRVPTRQLAVSSVRHTSHADAPKLLAYVPVEQAIWAVEPLQKNPLGEHVSQTLSTVVLHVEISNSPGAQIVHGVGGLLNPRQ